MILTYETNTRQGKVFNIKAWNAEITWNLQSGLIMLCSESHSLRRLYAVSFLKGNLIVTKNNAENNHNKHLVY